MKRKLLLLLIFLSTASVAADLTYEQALTKADRDEASLSAAQTNALVAAQGAAAKSSFAKCPVPSPHADLSPFVLVMELDANGKVVRTWLHGSSPIAICFHSQMATKSLSKPPRTPFYTSFNMSWNP